jgi:hypothetical protein
MQKRQTNQTADHREILATASVGDIAPEDAYRGQGLSSRNRAALRDGDDDRVTSFLAAGQWPRVFPGL